MKIIVCEDDKTMADEIFIAVKLIISELRSNYTVEVFTDSNDAYSNLSSYDIAFLDIEMPDKSGIEIAKALRIINPYIIIFIITSYDSYLDEALDINVFRYLNKPIDMRRLKNGIIKAVEKIDNSTISVFVSYLNYKIKIAVNDIEYITIDGKKTVIRTTDKSYTSDYKIDYWGEKLNKKYFIRTHKSYIVNLIHIKRYARDYITVDNGDQVPISYRKRSEFKKVFLESLGGQ